MTITDNSPDALADRLEEAALASLPLGSGELAQALAEANAVRRGEEPWGDVTVSDMQVALAERDARIARAAEGLVGWKAALSPTEASPDFWAAWGRLVEAVEGGGEIRDVSPAGDQMLREAREAGFEECEKLVTNMLLEAVKRNQDTADERARTAADGEGVHENEIRIPAIRAQALREAAMAVRMGQARRSKAAPAEEGGGE